MFVEYVLCGGMQFLENEEIPVFKEGVHVDNISLC